MARTKREFRNRRKTWIRSKVKGTPERPRLSVFRSARHIYAQVIDDETHRVLAATSTMSKGAKDEFAGTPKGAQAEKIGTKIAERCKTQGIAQVVFDRNGYKYHGRVKALADAARKAGLSF
jgi:large subunit ribosomal protein L18